MEEAIVTTAGKGVGSMPVVVPTPRYVPLKKKLERPIIVPLPLICTVEVAPPGVAAAVMVPQITWPVLSVVSAFVVAHEASVCKLRPPVRMSTPAKVEEAVALKRGARSPLPRMVLVPVVKFALPLIEKSVPGVAVATPTFPFPSTLNRGRFVLPATENRFCPV